jgi:opacity protein-like surface antigen
VKKSISILVLLALVAVGAFAQGISLSAGGGLLLDYSARNGVEVSTKLLGTEYTVYSGNRNLSFGGYGFFDFTYGEVDLSFAYGSLSSVYDSNIPGDNTKASSDSMSAIQLGFTVLGKYPFDLGGFTVFPLFGLGYNAVLSLSYDGNSLDDPGDYSQFGLMFGGGLDYFFSDALFLRAELLFNIRFASTAQDDVVSLYKLFYGSDTTVDSTWGMGPRVKVGVGYRFF